MQYNFTPIENMSKSRMQSLDGAISISASGRITLGRKFAQDHGLSSGDRANLYWDAMTNTLAFTIADAAQRPSGNSYTIGFVSGDVAYIFASSFFKTTGIDLTEIAGMYPYQVVKANDAGIADASGEVFTVSFEEDRS